MWFCSQECVDNAKKDLLIKDIDWDWYTYQNMRSTIKVKPEMFEHYINATTKHIDEWLWDKIFNHKKSQKEEVIFND